MSTNGKVSSDQRFTASHPCPICKGHDDLPRGRGERCTGYLSGNGRFAFCERTEAPETIETATGTLYKHRLDPVDRLDRPRAPANGNGKPKGKGHRTPQEAIKSLARWMRQEKGIDFGGLAGDWTYHDRGGRPVMVVFRFDRIDPDTGERSKTYRPVHRGADDRWRSGDPEGLLPLYQLPTLAGADLVVITEGEKAADAVRSLGLVATSPAHGAQSPGRSDWSPLAGKDVVILPDNDDPGRAFADHLVSLLSALDPPPTIKVLELPELPAKGDAVEFVRAGGTGEYLRDLIEAVDPVELPPEVLEALPEIVCGSDDPGEGFKRWTPRAIDALKRANRRAKWPTVYQRGTKLVRVRPGESEEPPTIEPLSLDAMRGELDRAAQWGTVYQTKRGPEVRYGPPRLDVAKDLMSLASYEGFPVLEMIAESPRFLPDGSLVLEPGYHEDGRIFYAPTHDLVGLNVPDHPTDADVDAARNLVLEDLLHDFPFGNRASKANAFALFLLPFARLLIEGPTPNHHAEASTEGTGKGLLIQACLMPAVGYEPVLTPPKEDDAEWRKLLTTHFLSGASYLIADNMANTYDRRSDDYLPIDSPSLAQAWTASRYMDRKLGGNTEVRVTVRTVFCSTGNNVEWSRELRRRLVPIQLLTPCEDPSSRTGFKHEPLLDWVRENRRGLVRAALVLIRRWFDEGRPEGSQVMGSFERYARVMGGILGSIGVEGFLANRKVGGGNDRERIRWTLFTQEWHRQHATRPVRARDLVQLVEGTDALGDAFADILGEGSERSRSQRMGFALQRNINRVCGEWRIVVAGGDRHHKIGLYRLQDPKDGVEDESQPEGDPEAETQDINEDAGYDWDAF